MSKSEIAERAARREKFSAWYKANYLKIAGVSSWVERAWAAYEAGAIEESRGQRWIPVEEKLPELNAYVWFWVPSLGEHGNWETGYFRDSPDEGAEFECERTGPQDEFIVYDEQQVSHWMLAALPDPPKGNENV